MTQKRAVEMVGREAHVFSLLGNNHDQVLVRSFSVFNKQSMENKLCQIPEAVYV